MTRSGPILSPGPTLPRVGSRSAALDVLVGCAVSPGVDRGFAVCRRDHVDIGVIAGVVENAAPDLEDLGVALRAILEAMAVRIPGAEPGRVAGAQGFLSVVGH